VNLHIQTLDYSNLRLTIIFFSKDQTEAGRRAAAAVRGVQNSSHC
jgi:hypothetical protein